MARWPGARNASRRRIGTVGTIKLVEARQTARDWLLDIEKGIDPQEEKAQAKSETFEAVAEAYIADYLPKFRSGRNSELRIRRVLIPAFGKRSVHDITPADVSHLILPRSTFTERFQDIFFEVQDWCRNVDQFAVLDPSPTQYGNNRYLAVFEEKNRAAGVA